MSKLEQLINELCPDGVEFKCIWELTAWDKKFNAVDKTKQKNIIKYNYYLAADLKALERDNGNVKILTTSITDSWAREDDVSDTLSEGEIVCIPWGGNPVVQYYKGKFITGDNRIATSIDTSVLDNKFLYYCLLNRLNDIASFYRGSGIKHPDMSKVLDLRIPVPPLEVQREIVRVLDNFTLLTAELTAELTARKKQYEYYRDELFNVTEKQLVPITDIAYTYIGLVTTMTKHYVENGIRLIHNSSIKENRFVFKEDIFLDEQFATQNNNRRHQIDDVVTVHTGDVGTSAVIDESLDGSLGFATIVSRIYDKEKVMPKYLCYYLNSRENKNNIVSMIKGDRNNLNLKDFNKLKIPVPSFEEQQRIVSILDRFDSLCNDISAGIPAEIEVRRKQYEYYRDKLLSFKEISEV